MCAVVPRKWSEGPQKGPEIDGPERVPEQDDSRAAQIWRARLAKFVFARHVKALAFGVMGAPPGVPVARFMI